jgi:hypothetical protein
MKYIVIAANHEQARLIMKEKGLPNMLYAATPDRLRGIGAGWTILIAARLWHGSEDWGHAIDMAKLSGAVTERVFT